MKVKSMIRRGIIKSLQLVGYDFDKISLEGALQRCRARGMQIGTVIDVGASNGMWTEKCVKFFPDAAYFLVEAQSPHEPYLRRLKQKMPKLDYVMAAAGDTVGEIYFDASHLLGGLASYEPFAENNITVPVTTIDALVEQHHLQPPFLIKLDTHGFEVPILAGAQATLAQTGLLVIEVYNFEVAKGSLLFHEMCAYLEPLGFRCVDMCDPLHRPRDGALWQFDLFFGRTDSDVWQSPSYE